MKTTVTSVRCRFSEPTSELCGAQGDWVKIQTPILTILMKIRSCDAVIYNKYISLVLTLVLGSQFPKPLEFLEQYKQWEHLLPKYLVSCLQCLKLLQSHKGEMGVLLFTTSLFPPRLGVNDVPFGNHVRMRLLARLELSVLP